MNYLVGTGGGQLVFQQKEYLDKQENFLPMGALLPVLQLLPH
jgi:hypothetical protein